MSFEKIIKQKLNLDKIVQENMQFREQYFKGHPTANVQEFKRYILPKFANLLHFLLSVHLLTGTKVEMSCHIRGQMASSTFVILI